jgi:DedD protein
MDGEIDLKKQARRRLIGAVALVTAVVVILPMVLDNEPKPAGQNIELRIPDKDKAGEFTSQMVLPESAPVPIGIAESQPVAVPLAAAPQMTPVQPAKPEQVQPVKAKPAHVEPKHVEPKHVVPKHVVPKDGFVLQVGAFSHAAAAKELQAKLHKHGWHVYTEKAGDKTRVRVGSYSTRAAAEKEMHKLEAQGMHPVVIHLN